MAQYLAVSTAVTDEIFLPDGNAQMAVLGGAGIYALAGMKVWCDDIQLITGTGADFLALHGAWFADNGLSMAGLQPVVKQTPRNRIQYFANGEREETPVLGADHYRAIKPTAAQVALHSAQARGVYVFRNADPDFWAQLLPLKAQHGFQLMWEIAADAATPAHLAAVQEIVRSVDVFSINVQEAFHLFATDSIETAVARLQAFQLPLVYFRMGANGAALITRNMVQHVPSVEDVLVVDPTGGGNSSSGAVLVGFCEGQEPLMCGIMGTISAAYSISQYGPPPVMNTTTRQKAQELAAEEVARHREFYQ